MGIMAREFEQMQLAQVYQATPDESPAKIMVLREMFLMSSSPNKLKMVAALDQMLAPPDEETQQRNKLVQELSLRKLIAEVNELENKAVNQGAQAAEHAAKANDIVLEGSLKDEEMTVKAMDVHIRGQEAAAYTEQVRLQARDNGVKTALKVRELNQKDRKLDIDEKKANKPTGAK
jgi:hypothetical protein